MLYNFWFSVGSFFAPLALQVMSTYAPKDFRTPIYTQWAHIGIMLGIYIFLPESPAWCASRGLEERAKKNMRVIYRGVTGFDIDAQYMVLEQTIQHEKAMAAEQKSEKWYNIFKGVNGFRTIVSTWALTSQQVLGLTLFYTYSAYFFSTAGIADPFAITMLTNGIQLVIILLVAASVDRFGRRNICCGGLTTMLVAVTLIGILGVVEKSDATNKLLVFFSCIFSKTDSFVARLVLLTYSCRPSMLWLHRVGICRRNLLPATPPLHGRFRCRNIVCRRRHHERPGTLHAQRKRVELGLENGLFLHRSRRSFCHWRLVYYSRACRVSFLRNVALMPDCRPPNWMNTLKTRSNPGASTRPRRRCNSRSTCRGSSSSHPNRVHG